MTEYLLSVHMVEGVEPPPPDVMERMYRDVDELNKKLQDEGVWVFAGGLHEASTATVVREQDGEVLTTDGPFAEAKEQLGGFWVIKVPDLDAARGDHLESVWRYSEESQTVRLGPSGSRTVAARSDCFRDLFSHADQGISHSENSRRPAGEARLRFW